jgi:hypothetical protein
MNRAFYKYNFVSTDDLYAIIQEELKSYFATGAIDDVMFPTWTDKCLRKLGMGSFPILMEMIKIDDFVGRLPANFLKAREVWACAHTNDVVYTDPAATYTELSTKICDSSESRCAPSCEFPEVITVVYKTQKQQVFSYRKQWLLRPGNISVRQYCSDDCFNFASTCIDTFDIHGNKLVTSFREGSVFLLYYASAVDNCGGQVIPDNFRIQEYIEAYIKYKLFEQLCNQTTDETYNQIERKKQEYKAASDEAFVLAETETKKKTIEQKMDSINHTLRRNRRFIIR